MYGGIGYKGLLPWDRHKEDMKAFQTYTLGSTIVMGRKTAESLIKPLHGRTNVVLSHTLPEDMPGGWVIKRDKWAVIDDHLAGELFIIGGAEIYKLFEPYADRLYRTVIEGSYECDTHMPAIAYSRDYDLVGTGVWTNKARHEVYNRKGTV